MLVPNISRWRNVTWNLQIPQLATPHKHAQSGVKQSIFAILSLQNLILDDLHHFISHNITFRKQAYQKIPKVALLNGLLTTPYYQQFLACLQTHQIWPNLLLGTRLQVKLHGHTRLRQQFILYIYMSSLCFQPICSCLYSCLVCMPSYSMQ